MTNNNKEIVAVEKKQARNNRRGSLFVALFDKLGELIHVGIINGFFAKIFTLYQSLQKKFTEGFCGRILFGNHRIRRFCRKGRKVLSNVIDSCFFMSAWKRCSNYLCSLPLNYYGNFTFFFGLYTLMIYVAKLLIPGLGVASADYIVIGAALTLASIPMMFSKLSLALSAKKSVICRTIFKGAFGIPDDAFNKSAKVRGKGNFMLFLGLVAGTLTFFINPIYMIAAFLALFLTILIATTPEIGVIFTAFAVPFLSFFDNPTIILSFLVLFTSFFYLLKLIRGKRVFKIELIDAFVVLFMAFIFASSFFSAGGDSSAQTAWVYISLILGYFLVTNLLRTEKWILRCIYALIGSATIVSFIGIYENFFAESNSSWLDLSLFSGIRIRVVSLFENPNVLSVFLTLILPFVLAAFCLSKAKNEKVLTSIVGAVIIACIVFTWSRGAWLAAIIGMWIFCFMYCRKKTFRMLGVLLLALPLVPMLVPDNVIDRFLSMFNLADSSIAYRIYTWRGTLAAIKDYWFGGIGVGEEAFGAVYPNYAYSGIEAAEHSHSLFLQILISLGIFGLIIFGIIIFLSLQKSFEYVKSPENKTSKVYVIATIASIISAMVMGVFDYIWYNYRVFYIFWIVLAIGCAFIRVGNYEYDRKKSLPTDVD